MKQTSMEKYSDVLYTLNLIVTAFGSEGDKTDQKKHSLKMSKFTAHTYSV